MSTDRITRINELLRRELGKAVYRILPKVGVDLSCLTVTHVITSRDLRHARVLVSITGDADNKKRTLSAMIRCRAQFQAHINANVRLKYTPRLLIELDESVQTGDRVLGLLSELEEGTEDDA